MNLWLLANGDGGVSASTIFTALGVVGVAYSALVLWILNYFKERADKSAEILVAVRGNTAMLAVLNELRFAEMVTRDSVTPAAVEMLRRQLAEATLVDPKASEKSK